MGIALLVGLVLFRFRILGGGDVKLFAAAALWAGIDHLLELVIYIGIAGGAFALALILVRRLLVSVLVAQTVYDSVTLPRLLLSGEKIPYGVAIAGGAVLLGRGLPQLGLFL
jgi:prepilin peptidase CpaA